jgi:hypothetical protein
VVLKKALYIPTIDINLFSGIRHYKAGGYLDRETLKGPSGATIAVLDFQRSGFFLQIEGCLRPRLHLTSYSNIVGTRYSLAQQTTEQLMVKLPSKSQTWKDSYTRYDDNEPSSIELDSRGTIGSLGPSSPESQGIPRRNRPRNSDEGSIGLGAPGNRGL